MTDILTDNLVLEVVLLAIFIFSVTQGCIMKAREDFLKEIGALKSDVEYWETQAKTLEARKVELQGELHKAKAELKLWMGTGI